MLSCGRLSIGPLSARHAAIAVLLLVYGASLGANWIAPAGYATQFRDSLSARPSWKFPLGTDELGRDVFSRMLYGSRISLFLAPAAAILSTALAAAIGGLAGYAGGIAGSVAMRFCDLFMSLPWLFLLLTIRAILPLNVPPAQSIFFTFLLLGLLGWAAPARVVWAGARAVGRQEFLIQARASGYPPLRMFIRQLVPNLRPILAAQFWVSIPVFILSEANLGLLGLGAGEPLPSWGSLLRGLENPQVVARNPWVAAPAALLVLVVGCFHFLAPAQDYSK
jgi:peptide/nickel transport system permease protein